MRKPTALLCALGLLYGAAAQAHKPEQGAEGWPDYGGTLAGQRYSSARQITPANVKALQTAWVFHTHDLDKPSERSNPRASFESTPVLWGRTLFFTTPFDAVFAVDAATGQQRWSFDPGINREAAIYIVTSRGVALWHAKRPTDGVCGSDRVLLATLDRRLMALDANTGVPCPGFGKNGTVDLTQDVRIGERWMYGFTSPPTVVGDTVVLGSSVADNQTTFPASGAVRGFDLRTGRQKWSWEAVRWTAGQHPPGSGSGNAWAPMSADAEHDLVFVPTGSPAVDFYGGTRIGDNRDADSIVALRASTGERVWAFQLVHHDIWDYDTPSEPVLFTFRGKIPAVAVVTKTDMVFVFNRLTGEPLYPVEERPVAASDLPGERAWPTQPFSTLPPLGPPEVKAADLHLRDPDDQKFCEAWLKRLENHGLFTPPSIQGSLVSPGSMGGANWGSAAFDPATGVLYTRVSMMPFLVKQTPGGPRGESLGARVRRMLNEFLPEWMGGDPPNLEATFKTPDSGDKQRDESPQEGTPYRLARQGLMTPRGTPCGPPPFGSVVALNLDTGQKLWTVPNGEMVSGEAGSVGDAGVIATAGGLLFVASSNDGYLRGFDSKTGQELWRGKLPVPSNATPMTYSIDGRQFVVIAAGGHGFIGQGQSDAVVAFALPPGTPGEPAQPGTHRR